MAGGQENHVRSQTKQKLTLQWLRNGKKLAIFQRVTGEINLTKETKKYDGSLLADDFVDLFKTFKLGTAYKYLEMIEDVKKTLGTIIINYDELTDDS